jgi:hypothetical protein
MGGGRGGGPPSNPDYSSKSGGKGQNRVKK